MSNEEKIEMLEQLLIELNKVKMEFMCVLLAGLYPFGPVDKILKELWEDRIQEDLLPRENTKFIQSFAWYPEANKAARITNINRTIKRLQKEIENETTLA